MSRARRRLPPPNWLRAFEVAARHLSFTAAARELHVTQSAVSQQVRLLEQYLDEPLFVRHPRRLALTDTGAAYLVSVHEAFERLARSTDELFGQRSGERVSLRTSIAFATYFLAPRLAEFQNAHPDIDLRLSMSAWQAETVWDTVSLEVRHGSGAWAGLGAERLTNERITPLCSPRLVDAGRSLDTPADVLHYRRIRILGNGEDWERWSRAAGLDDAEPKHEMQCDNSVVAMEYAAAAGGIALGNPDLHQGLLKAGTLVAPFDLACDAPHSYYLLSPEARADSPAVSLLRAWLVEQTRPLRPGAPASAGEQGAIAPASSVAHGPEDPTVVPPA